MRSEDFHEAPFSLDLNADPVENIRRAVRAELRREARLKAEIRMYYDRYEGHLRTKRAVRTTGYGGRYLDSDDPAMLSDKLRRLRMVNAGLEGTRDNMLREIYALSDEGSRKLVPKGYDEGRDMRSRLEELSRRRRVKRHSDVYGTGLGPEGSHPSPFDLPAWNIETMIYLDPDARDGDQDLATNDTTEDEEEEEEASIDRIPQGRGKGEGMERRRMVEERIGEERKGSTGRERERGRGRGGRGGRGGDMRRGERTQDRVEVATDGTIVITLSDVADDEGSRSPYKIPYGSDGRRKDGGHESRDL